MRGLNRSKGLKAGSTAVAGLAALVLFVGSLAACTTGGTGTRDEGSAPTDRASGPTPPSSSESQSSRNFKRADAIALVKADSKVSADIKADLKPCAADEYPVDVTYGNLTGGSSPDVVVNVMTCGDAVGVGSYVYRPEGKKYKNVFMTEEPSAYSEIERGELVVTKQIYKKDDPVAAASAEEVTTYYWHDDSFVERPGGWSLTEYGGDIAGEAIAPEEN
ncbi:hypothetical protein [Streptomyces sp. NBC_01304]|uniref:hypothetical protein n=1 Tax=Streptomyces sp. NBC_01304 TaxID=2903818 RepID=UPI002E0F297F|nr:hypothetical protein OG430_22175 [Streptomyces sp. NBC_01304]